MIKVLVCISALLLTACNSTTSSNNDTIVLLNAEKTNAISYHKTYKECQSAKILQDIRSKAEWARNSVANRSSHVSGFKLATCEG
ncbi:hypothetical protein [Pseudoalteromonas undina]|uniref:Uncharacterized protein n=1 Tax=Pseudoalteromonas undina TaxID=43660 RepID=A0ACC6R175_9GAMM